MATLDDVNRLAASGVSEFRVQSYDGWRLFVVGSFDLCYYHDIELSFTDVAHINLPTSFSWPAFADVGMCQCGSCERRRFAVQAEGSQWEVVAQAAEVVIGKVFHYDRGTQLRAGERIADWVQRKPGEGGYPTAAVPTRDRRTPDSV